MANIPFLSFPSFASTNRFEHSIGVCYLAQEISKTLELSQKDKIELMLASLYHDVATPPFAHAVEEAMERLFGFNHERKLKEIITGEAKDLGGQKHQVYLGRSLKIHRICQSQKGQQIGLDLYRIADLAVGITGDPIGDLVCSQGIDLDNIDNVIRASTAMGIKLKTPNLPEHIIKGFCTHNGVIAFHESTKHLISEWQELRKNLYNLIFASISDFSQQTMLKEAIQLLADELNGFVQDDWSLTDNELLYNRLAKFKPTNEILRRLKLGDTYNCLAIYVIEGESAIYSTKNVLDQIEAISKEEYLTHLSERLNARPKSWDEIKILANFYVDKRHRATNRPYVFMGVKNKNIENLPQAPRVILGIFTPYRRGLHKDKINLLSERLQRECLNKCTIRQGVIDDADYPQII